MGINFPGVDINEVDESQYIPGTAAVFCGMEGICERGPTEGEPTLITSWAAFRQTFGDLIAGSLLAYAAKKALDQGAALYIKRVTALDVNGVTTAANAVSTLSTAGGGSLAATIAGTVPGILWNDARTWPFQNGNLLGIKQDGGGPTDVTITATPATALLTNAATFALADLETILYRVGPASAPIRTLTLHTADFVAIGAATVAELSAVLARDMAYVGITRVANQITISTDQQGTGARLEFTGGTALAAVGLAVAVHVGGGNVADVDHVTSAELTTLVAVDAGVTFSMGATFLPSLVRSLTGAGHSLQLDVSNANRAAGAAALGMDALLHSGTNAAPVPTLQLDANSPGTWGNSLTVDILPATLNPATRFKMVINRNGSPVRTEDELTFTTTDARYVQTVFPPSDPYVIATDLLAAVGDQRPAQALGTVFAGGLDGLAGIADTDYIGDSAHKTGLYAFDSVKNVIAIGAPGNVSRNFQSSLFGYCQTRKDVFAVADVPQGLTVSQAKDFRLATGAYAGGAVFATTYGALYHNWPQVLDERVKGAKVFIPPMGDVMAVINNTIKRQNAWRAPAGPNNGTILNVTGFVSQLGDADIGALYDVGVNTLVNDPDFGPMVNGQKTLAATPSKLDRINVRMGLIKLRGDLRPGFRQVAEFEPNDPTTWASLDRIVDPYMKQQVEARGIQENGYYFKCDDKTNTAATIAAHQLVAKLFVKPTDTGEFIEVDVVILGNDVDLKVVGA